MNAYLTVTCRLPASAEEQLAVALERWPVLGCQVEESGKDLAITVFLDALKQAALGDVTRALRDLGGRDIATGHFAEQDWLAEYRRTAKPTPIGQRFWVDPQPGKPTPAPDGRIHLVVEPRQAFGSGSHESTRLVLLMLEDIPVAGTTVLDAGTGSGILALAARALGARHVVGFDIDLNAVFIARQIVREQRQQLPVAMLAGPVSALLARPAFDLVVANMIPGELVPLLPSLATLVRPHGFLLFSGVMADQLVGFTQELTRHRLTVNASKQLNEWVGLVCSPALN